MKLVLWALVPGLAFAGEIWGVVRDAAAAPLARAKVELTNGRTVLSGVTDSDGEIVFPNLPPGRYDVHVTSPGFSRWDMRGLEVSDGTSQVEANLQEVPKPRSFLRRLFKR